MRPIKGRTKRPTGPAELPELLLLICSEADVLAQEYGSLAAARERFHALVAAGEFGPTQTTEAGLEASG